MSSIGERFQILFLQMVPFIMAVVFHEVAHAFVARRHGDNTAERLGRLTFNPVPHIDPIGTILFPAFNMLTGIPILFGWARPVPIDYNRLRPYRRGLFLVALAGPACNFLLGFLAALFLVAFSALTPPSFYFYEPLRGMAFVGISINFALGVFNLIPLPPLDGSKMVEAFLSYNAVRKYEQLGSYSIFILLALLWSGALNVIAVPINFLSNLSVGVWAFLFSKFGLVHL